MKAIKFRLVSVLAILFLVLGLSGCQWLERIFRPDSPWTEPSKDAFAKVSEVRSRAERLVANAKVSFADDDAALKNISDKYYSAYDKGNAFIDALRVSITAKAMDVKFDKQADELLGAINELAETIRNESDKKDKKPAKPTTTKKQMSVEALNSQLLMSVASVSGVIKGLAEAGVVIWKAAKDEEWRRADELKEELEKYRWKKFDVIKS